MLNLNKKIDILLEKDRGYTETPWLKSHHSFSFGQYYNLDRLNFGTLRVFNEDFVQPGQGFGAHAHENMEIITIVLSGTLAHKDNAGHEGELKPYDVQRMTAGSGIKHSEVNPSDKEEAHFLQIWLHPQERDLPPSYEQKHFDPALFENTLYPIVASTADQMALTLYQDAALYLGHFGSGHIATHTINKKNRGCFIFVIEGSIKIDSHILQEKDSAQITHANTIQLEALSRSKVLLIEVGMSAL